MNYILDNFLKENFTDHTKEKNVIRLCANRRRNNRINNSFR